jgi:hypothetical protein
VIAAVGPLYLIVTASCVAAVIVRFRWSRGDERQQLKWFAYAAGLLLGFLLLNALAGGPNNLFFGIGLTLFPLATGIAVLRYRLYDIDRIINRTLVYGLLTALLGGVYAGAVLVLGDMFGGIGTEPPSWVVAGATLAVAALFQPARRRIQAAVDRRFNRRKYNAAKTVETFSARLRDQVDLDTLATELLAVTNKTMQPTTVSLWLRPPDEASKAHAPRWDY